ncbi:hypothetical protein LY76DRAFT_521790 [Colletotrichum caudatum]|nr:hypothetical protein LY76DRAFT_521790 [Colletotrichum caudatum]
MGLQLVPEPGRGGATGTIILAGLGTDANAIDTNDAPPTTDTATATAITDCEQGVSGQQPQAAALVRRLTRSKSFKTTSGPENKLTPPPQLHERKLLRVSSVSVRTPDHSPSSSSSSSIHQHHLRPDRQLLRRSRSLSVLQQQQQHHHHHHHHRQHQQSPPDLQDWSSARHFHVYLRADTRDQSDSSFEQAPESKQDKVGERGETPETQPPPSAPIRLRLLELHQQPPQPREPPPRPAPPPRLYPVPGRINGVGIAVPPLGPVVRHRATIANFNRKHRHTQSTISHTSTRTAAHHRSYWPDDFRDPRHGLNIGHSTLPIPPVPPLPKSFANERRKPPPLAVIRPPEG